MATLITKGGDQLAPLFVYGWDTARPARTVVHEIIARPDPDFTVRPSGTRRGTLTYLFADVGDAVACERLHADDPAPVTLADPDVPDGGGVYVVTGEVGLASADDVGTSWFVRVGFTEVPA